MKILVIDVETTGLSPETDKIVEVGVVEVVDDGNGWKIGRCADSFVNPGIPIPPEASGVHNIVDADVCMAPFINAALSKVLGVAVYLSDSSSLDDVAAIAAHNARFDHSFLPSLHNKRWIDTYRCALHLWPDAPNHKNNTLRYWLGIQLPWRGVPHRAGDDALVTAHILIHQLKKRSVDELIALSTKAVVLKKVGFGKHFGTLWTDVPYDYLEWAIKQDFEPDVKWTVKCEMERRMNLRAGR